jgi:hypothetical protein
VDWSAEAISALDVVWRRRAHELERWPRRVGRRKVERSVRTVAVVVDEDAEHAFEMLTVEDKEPVETFRADDTDASLGDRVRLRRTHRRAHDLDPLASEDRVKVAPELAVAIADQEPQRCRALGKRPGELARACWVTQAPLGFAVQPARCTRRLSSSMKKSTYNRCSMTVSTVKKSAASMLCACARRKSRQWSPLRSPTGPAQDPLHTLYGLRRSTGSCGLSG